MIASILSLLGAVLCWALVVFARAVLCPICWLFVLGSTLLFLVVLLVLLVSSG